MAQKVFDLKKEPTVFKNFNLETEKASRSSKPDLSQKKVSAKVSGKVLGDRKALTIAPTIPEPFDLSKSNTLDLTQDDQTMQESPPKN